MAGETVESGLEPVRRLALGWGARLWLGVVALLAVGLGLVDLYAYKDSLALRLGGARAQGISLGRVGGGDGGAPATPRYRFVAQEGPRRGQEFVGGGWLTAALGGAPDEGVPVQVIYLPLWPRLSMLAEEHDPAPEDIGWIVGEPFLLGSLLFGQLGVLWCMARLRWGGVSAPATVTARWRARGDLCVAYRFDGVSPRGQVRHLAKAEIDPWAYRHLQVGDAVTMRYLPENPAVSRAEYGRRRRATRRFEEDDG
jgi:hypothetical protein